ncbi:MAG: hypothetical protein FWF44_10130 [Defluviitaleaceae bacterium]|nr:hypothetical protein [Defluviitaleaceae bacterium]
MIGLKDKEIIHGLAYKAAEIAALPIQDEKRCLWSRLNALKPERPMVIIDQVCWSEINADDDLTLQCEDEGCRGYEWRLRSMLYQWEHFPADMVVEPFFRIQKAIGGVDFGVGAEETILKTCETSEVVSHRYKNQFETMEDIEKIKFPKVVHDAAETARRMETAEELFRGTLNLREEGYDPYISVWDPISQWMGVQNALYAIMDEPEMMRALAERMVACYMSLLDQMEEQGLLCHHQSFIHCTGAYTDELPAPGFDPAKPRTKDIWGFGLAQMFSTVSPAMFEEYEIDICMPLFARFGLMYYGCCDPLDGKMKEVRKIPNARKISMSPWTNQRRGAENIGRDYVFSRKPNPAYVADHVFDEELVRADLRETVNICRENGCPVELILKDISTVKNHPERLDQWNKIAMEVARG